MSKPRERGNLLHRRHLTAVVPNAGKCLSLFLRRPSTSRTHLCYGHDRLRASMARLWISRSASTLETGTRCASRHQHKPHSLRLPCAESESRPHVRRTDKRVARLIALLPSHHDMANKRHNSCAVVGSSPGVPFCAAAARQPHSAAMRIAVAVRIAAAVRPAAAPPAIARPAAACLAAARPAAARPAATRPAIARCLARVR